LPVAAAHDDRGAVLRPVAQRSPHFIARILVQRDDARSFAANMQDHQVVVNERGGRDTPLRQANRKLLVHRCQRILPLAASMTCIMPVDPSANAFPPSIVTDARGPAGYCTRP
jgi:hypothetical protein